MSKSRLEKFLYALYSLDSSDLPTPLSRIEELYKCLVTRDEAPTFEPLSRVEKYLMAILGAYDADSLPNPLSRVEVLLYKLTTGDDNLDDVKSFLSEHEELLAEIIRNGGIGENIDIEYVLYTLLTEHNTLYNTAEKPVKSAILKGDSQRVFSPTKNLFDGELEQGTVNSYTGINNDLSSAIRSKNFVEIGVNTAFTLSRKKGTASLGFRCYDKNKNFLGTIFNIINGGTLKATYTTDSNTVYIRFIDNTNDLTNKYQIEIGSTATDYEEPNYELKSVKMPVLTTTSYEPFKTNILTVNEPIELRGIGDVKDELNLLTGELTSSLGEVVLDGTQKRMSSQKWGNYTKTRFNLIGAKDTRSGGDDVPLMSDKLKPYGYWGEADNGEYFFTGNNYIDIVHSNEKDIAQWLKDNPTLIIYPLIESTIKTVDLSVVDQDGNNTKLSTFNDITHVTLSSEGLIPEAELEVATKNEEDLEDSSVYTTYTLSEEFNTLYNTAEKPIKSAILKGSTKYRDIDTGDVLDTFDKTKNLELVSVKVPVLTTVGKNLFDKTKIIFDKLIDWSTGNISDDSVANITDFIKVIPNTQYTMSFNFETRAWTRCVGFTEPKHDKYATDVNGKSDKCYFDSDSKTIRFTTSPTTKYLLFSFGKGVEESFQLEQGSTATSYEPYKSNILTVNEPIELRGIGDVKDKLNCLTGEVTKLIGEIVLNEDITGYLDTNYSVNGYSAFRVTTIDKISNELRNVICDKVKYYPNINLNWGKQEEFFTANGNLLFLKILSTKASNFEELRTFLSSSPITIQYELAESIKTVDLSVVDQDGNDTKLKTFNDITHVTLSSEGLIPEAELEVAEKVPEVAANMLGISREQEVINTTTNEQSENIDSTMIATTEIYEELL